MTGSFEYLKAAEEQFLQEKREPFQAMAWSRLQEMQLPTRKTDSYGYVNLNPLYKLALPSFTSAFTVSCGEKRVVAQSFTEARKTFGAFIANHIKESVKTEKDPFVLLNTALFREGTFIYVPPDTTVDTKIILQGSASRLFIVMGRGAKAAVLLRDAAENSVIDITLDEESELDVVQGEATLSALRATQKKGSRLSAMHRTRGSHLTRYDYQVRLQGDGSSCSLKGLATVKEKNQAHAFVHVIHEAPHTTSNQLFKNVLEDEGHTSFEGKIFVESKADKTEAYQLNNNLLLSDLARAESKPNLEIFADDVKASHGATFGQIDEEQLHYMQTRGLSRLSAKKLLLDAFTSEFSV